MRVFKALYLVPEQVELLAAIRGNLFDVRTIIDALAVFKHLNKQFPCRKIGEGFCFPCGVGVKDRMRLCVVNKLVINAELVGERLAALAVVVAVELLEVGVGDLRGVLADLDLGLDVARGVLDRDKLINAAENRRA